MLRTPICAAAVAAYGPTWIAAIITERDGIHPYSRFTWEGEYLGVGTMLLGFALAIIGARCRTHQTNAAGPIEWLNIGLGLGCCAAYLRYFEPLLAFLAWLSWAETVWRLGRAERRSLGQAGTITQFSASSLCTLWVCLLLAARFGF